MPPKQLKKASRSDLYVPEELRNIPLPSQNVSSGNEVWWYGVELSGNRTITLVATTVGGLKYKYGSHHKNRGAVWRCDLCDAWVSPTGSVRHTAVCDLKRDPEQHTLLFHQWALVQVFMHWGRKECSEAKWSVFLRFLNQQVPTHENWVAMNSLLCALKSRSEPRLADIRASHHERMESIQQMNAVFERERQEADQRSRAATESSRQNLARIDQCTADVDRVEMAAMGATPAKISRLAVYADVARENYVAAQAALDAERVVSEARHERFLERKTSLAVERGIAVEVINAEAAANVGSVSEPLVPEVVVADIEEPAAGPSGYRRPRVEYEPVPRSVSDELARTGERRQAHALPPSRLTRHKGRGGFGN